MSETAAQKSDSEAAEWWSTGLTRVEPGRLELIGHPIQELILDESFVSVVWLLLRGERPSVDQARLMEGALVSSVDHGVYAPSIAAARMAATCGVGLNNAVATGVNLLGDIHGGAGQQCMEFFREIANRMEGGADIEEAAAASIAKWREVSKYLPGFGHPIHPTDPRREPLYTLLERARDSGTIEGRYLTIARATERVLSEISEKPVPINVDGITAVVYAELGFSPPLARGLFVLARSVGILAHAWEEVRAGSRLKGPLPPSIRPVYLGRADV